MSCFALQACVKVGRFAENALKSAGNGTFHICAQEQYRNCGNAGRPSRGKTSVDGRLFSGHMIAITTNSSISVKPLVFPDIVCLLVSDP
jgi:hypothetical protein